MTNAKIAAIITLGILIVAAIVCAVVFYQVPFDFEISDLHAVENDVVLLSAEDPLNHSGSPALAKVKDGKISEEDFRILFLTDVHLCERKESTRQTIERFTAWIYREKPDLIVLGGDTLNGLNDRVRVEQFRALMDRFQIYWAPVLGNHEGDRPLLMTSRKEIVRYWSKSAYCLMESDEKKTADGRKVDGYGNYVVSVLGSDGYIKDALFLLDNGSKLMKKSEYEKWGVEKKADTAISETQVDWYDETYLTMKEKNGGSLTHMCVIHKPLPEFGEALSLPSNLTYGEVADWTFSFQGVEEGWEIVDGTLRDKVHYPPYRDGELYDALTKNGAKAVFFGHDHVNDLTLYHPTDDIYLTYIRLTTVTEHVPDAEGYNILAVKATGGYNYRAYKTDGSLDAALFEA